MPGSPVQNVFASVTAILCLLMRVHTKLVSERQLLGALQPQCIWTADGCSLDYAYAGSSAVTSSSNPEDKLLLSLGWSSYECSQKNLGDCTANCTWSPAGRCVLEPSIAAYKLAAMFACQDALLSKLLTCYSKFDSGFCMSAGYCTYDATVQLCFPSSMSAQDAQSQLQSFVVGSLPASNFGSCSIVSRSLQLYSMCKYSTDVDCLGDSKCQWVDWEEIDDSVTNSGSDGIPSLIISDISTTQSRGKCEPTVVSSMDALMTTSSAITAAVRDGITACMAQATQQACVGLQEINVNTTKLEEHKALQSYEQAASLPDPSEGTTDNKPKGSQVTPSSGSMARLHPAAAAAGLVLVLIAVTFAI